MAVIIGTPGDDSSLLGGQDLIGTSVADQISGLAGRDLLNGQAGNDTLLGGEGNDELRGGTGDDTLDGGEGSDQVREAADVNFTLTNNKLVGNGTDTLISIESVVLGGGVGNNRMDASAFAAGFVVFDGGAGNDTLLGGSGADLLIGGSGNNVINGGAGIDRIQADAGDGSIILTNTTLTTNGGAGVDTFTGIELASLFGRNGNNLLDASTFQGSVAFFGGLGNDTLLGGFAADSFTANAGNDSLNGGAGVDRVVETGTNFTLSNNSLLGNGTDTLVSIETAILTGNGSDSIINAANPFFGMFTNGSVTFNGEAGDDTLIGGANNDTLNGGAGIDQVQATGDVNFTLTNTSLSGLGTDTLNEIETARLAGGSSGNIINASGFNRGSVNLSGGGGNDTLSGGGNGDFLNGGVDNDGLDGNGGRDTLFGQAGDDVLSGNAEDDSLNGSSGNDLLFGDTFFGQDVGNDTLAGGADDDLLAGGGGTDAIVESGDVNFTLTNDQLTGLGTDTLSSIEFATLIGGSGNNTINAANFNAGSVFLDGGFGRDALSGGSNDDTLLGGDGDDQLNGGLGFDILNGGLGFDEVSETGVATNVTITDEFLFGINGFDALNGIERVNLLTFDSNDIAQNKFIDASFFSGSLNLFIGGNSVSNDTIFGGAGNDTIGSGAGGSDFVSGGNGDDILSGSPAAGGDGTDTLSGGAGSDVLNSQGSSDILIGGNAFDTQFSFDRFIGFLGADTFVLSDGDVSHYQGAGFATIDDYRFSDGDRIDLAGSPNQYTLTLGNTQGGSGIDTSISLNGDLIAIVADANLIAAGIFI